MAPLLTRTGAPADADLIAAVRDGDTDAYGVLFERHVQAARRLAGQLVHGPDADDLVSEAFAKVLGVLQRGGGPDVAFRAYLLTSVRRLHVDRIRQQQRLHTTDDLEPYDPGVPFVDTAVEGFESQAAARAFASLPERWQVVLWHTEVEGQRPAEIAPMLGMSANSVAAMAYRAREGLRQAFLGQHVQDLEDADCEWTHQQLGGFVRGALSKRDSAKVRAHLGECRRCTAIYVELTEVNSELRGLLAPLLLGGAATGYLAGTTPVHVTALPLLAHAKALAAAHAPATVAASTAAAVVIGTVVVAGVRHEPRRVEGAPSAEVGGGPAPSAGLARPASPGIELRERSERPRRSEARGTESSATGPTYAPPASQPSQQPTQPSQPSGQQPAQPDQHPATQQPGQQPTQPTEQPGPGHSPQHPGGGPADPGGATSDVGLDVSYSQSGQGTYRFTATVRGASAQSTATLSVQSATGSALVVHDQRCSAAGKGGASCSVSDAPAVYSFKTAAPHGGAITFVVTPDDGTDDSLTNNTVVVALV